jgi:hypothetical protein
MLLVLVTVHQFMVVGWFNSSVELLDLEARVLVQFWC